MSRALNAATKTALTAGQIIERGMVRFDFGSGSYGFWTGIGPFTHNAQVYVGAGSLIEADGFRQTDDLSATQVVLRLTSIPNTELTPDVLATIENEQYHQKPATVMTAYFNAETRALLSVEVEYRGYVDRVVHTENIGGQAVLEFHLESRFRDHQRTGYRVRSDADQKLISANDDSMKHVATVQNEKVLFGRSEQPPPKPQKKGFWESLFG